MVSTTAVIRPREAADGRAAGRAVLPQHRHEQHREVGRGRDREGQRHHEGDVLLLEGDAQHHRDHTEHQGGDARTSTARQVESAAALLMTPWRRSCDTAEAPDSVRPATTARMVANATAEMKPRRLPPTALARWIAAMLPPPIRPPLPPIQKPPSELGRHQMMIAPKPMMKVRMLRSSRSRGRPEHRLAGFLGIRHGEEAHQDVRQAGGAEHQRHAEARSPRSDP